MIYDRKRRRRNTKLHISRIGKIISWIYNHYKYHMLSYSTKPKMKMQYTHTGVRRTPHPVN